MPFTSWQGTPCPADSQSVHWQKDFMLCVTWKYWPMLDSLKTTVRLPSLASSNQSVKFHSSLPHSRTNYTLSLISFLKNHNILGDLRHGAKLTDP